MHPAIRAQKSDAQEYWSALSALNCSLALEDGSPNVDRARQEFKKETEVNDILRRFGVTGATQQRQGTFGEQDFTLDLQQALSAIEQTKAAYRDMPNDLQRRYPTWQRFLNAIERGDLTLHQTDPEQKIVPPEQAPLSVSDPKTKT